jgi:hypothetical protein
MSSPIPPAPPQPTMQPTPDKRLTRYASSSG